MEKRHVVVAAHKGLKAAKGNLNARFVPSRMIKMFLTTYFSDQSQIDSILQEVQSHGYAYAESTSDNVVPMCMKIMTEEHMDKLI